MAKDRKTVVTVVTDDLPSAGEAAGPACLVLLYGQTIGTRHFLDKDEVIIGRSEACDIQVEQDSVSRQHAKILVQSGRAFVEDLESTNGTFINDEPVGEVELRDGDFIRIGQTIFKYLSGTNIESKYHEEIYRLTTVDGLTQAYNKRYFLEALERELNRALRYRRDLALVLLDIDHFKKVNDTYGHLAGDHVLRELAGLVAENLRRDDVFARYGGEEFAIILPEVDGNGAVTACEKLRSLIEAHDFSVGGESIPVRASFGIRAVRDGEDAADAEQFIADADAKLYEAKQSGRNRTCC